jgi:hypothetical protein
MVMEFKPKQDTRDAFEELCSKHLDFLFNELAFKVISVEKDNYGCFITYRNDTTALKAGLCPLDGRISFDIYRLIDGEIPKYPLFFDPRAELLVFNLDMLTILKTGKYVEHNRKHLFNKRDIERIVKEYAVLLKQYAFDVLRGDFSVLPEIKTIIARRAKELEHEQ